MKEQLHYINLLTKEFFEKYYVELGMSFPVLSEHMKKIHRSAISIGTLHKYAKRHGIGRSRSEAKRKRDPDALDWNQSLLNEDMIDSIDGFLLGDGRVKPYYNKGDKNSATLVCGVQYQEFAIYFSKFFGPYRSVVKKNKDPSMVQGFRWDMSTKSHAELFGQYQRWYRQKDDKMLKHVPGNVRLTPKSVMMWYLGDGSIVINNDNNTVVVRLSTDGFAKANVEFLVVKLTELGISCRRNNENRIYIEAKGIPAFFNFIGSKSPVKCYDYKFQLPKWRLHAKRMSEVAVELGIDYHRLSYLVKIGKIPCYRASKKGRPRFLPEHIDACKESIKKGLLS